jgi:6-phospho-beta-glucosidase
MILSVVGGGGMRTPLLISGLIDRHDEVPVDRVILHDIDADTLAMVRAIADARIEAADRPFALHTTTSLDEATDGVDYLITSIRVGGLAGRVIDERVPLDHGIIGQETTGPGGWAMALRTIPVLQEIIARLRERSKTAWVLNFTNPAGLITQALTAAGERRVIGICDSPAALVDGIAKRATAAPSDLRIEYVGLNHLGWVRAVRSGIRDLLPEILAGEDVVDSIYGRPLFTSEELRELKLLPNEYLHYYYHHDEAVARMKAAATRGDAIADIAARLREEVRSAVAAGRDPWPAYEAAIFARRSSYMATETGQSRTIEMMGGNVEGGYARAAISVIESMVHGGRRDLIVNTTNRGAITDLDDADVVELPCRVTSTGPLPRSSGTLPEPVADLVKGVKRFERETVTAAARRSWTAALLALSRHPLVPSLAVAEEIGEEYRRRHAPHLDYLR